MLSGVSLFRTNSIGSALYISYYNYSFTKTYQTPTHRWELPVLCYHGIRGTYHYPFLGVNFSVILHDFIRNNYHKNQSDRYPLFFIASKYHIYLGFMVYYWLMLFTVVTVIIRTLIPINSKLVLCFSEAYPVEA